MATIYKRKGIWWIQYYYKGKRIQRSLRTRDQKDAKGELEWQKAKLVLAQEEERPSEITLDKYIEVYMSQWSRSRKSRRTQEYDQSNVDRYRKQFSKQLKNITASQVNEYIESRRQSCQVSTVNRELGFIKAFFNKAVEWGYLSKSPAAGLKAFKQRPRVPRFFTKREVDLLLDKSQKLSSYLHVVILSAIMSGLRKSELIHLSWEDINLENNTLIVQAKGDWHRRTTK